METKDFVKDLIACRASVLEETSVLSRIVERASDGGGSATIAARLRENGELIGGIDKMLKLYGAVPGAASSRKNGKQPAAKPAKTSGRITPEEKTKMISLWKDDKKTIEQIAEHFNGRFNKAAIYYHLNKVNKGK